MEFREFKVINLIRKVTRGTRLVKAKRIPGNVPLITAGSQSQGIADYILNPDQARFTNAITVDMFGNVFNRDYTFCCDDNILALEFPEISPGAMLYLTTSLQKAISGYNYGAQYRLGNLNKQIILLPITPSGTPDFAYMEQYLNYPARP